MATQSSDENHEADGNSTSPGREVNSADSSDNTLVWQDEPLCELMASNFIEYASYVVKERAIPHINDGLKPVQRRILHSLYEMDDGRYHKVANVIGHTMQYHPHGDASINSALVVLANKEYFIDKQGNFGNIVTGDAASAARYIECRLTQLARDVLFNPEITEYEDSYDGRNSEPVTLPAKTPVLLMLGAEGIAVGMSTRILPHNFNELLQAQIAILQGESYEVYPDFLTGGLADVSDYRDGLGKIKVRARIEVPDKKTLIIRELPAGSTTESLISSIEDAVRHNKIKISSIKDYTAEEVEIQIKLPRGVYAQETLKQLYAYTDCEYTISSQTLIIRDNRPVQLRISEIIQHYTDQLVEYLKQELNLDLHKHKERVHQKTLTRIFIENRIYKSIEDCETYESIMQTVTEGLEPFKHELQREVSTEDIEKLLQLHIRRISQFDIERNKQDIEKLQEKIKEIQHNLDNLTQFAIDFLQNLLDKHGEYYPRRTEITELGAVDAREVALKNIKVGHDRQRGFVGSEVKNSNKGEDYLVCTEYDRLVLLGNDGRYRVVGVPKKRYVGPTKYVLKADKNQVYAMIYRDRKTGKYYAKRFRIDRYILDREYRAAPDNAFIERLYPDPTTLVRCEFKPGKRQKHQSIDVDFTKYPLRSASARGFKIAEKPIQKFTRIQRESSADEETSTENMQQEGDQREDGETGNPSPATGKSATGGKETTHFTGQNSSPRNTEAPGTHNKESGSQQTSKSNASGKHSAENQTEDSSNSPSSAKKRIDPNSDFFLE